MSAFWYGALAAMFSTYAVLDGFDFGAGALNLFLARDDRERRQVLAAIGPVWDGNEVWLIAGGGTFFFAFPRAYATAFSGFYLPLMLALWLLGVRGIAIELRSHLENPLWRAFWDAGLCGASALMAVVLGVALGNVLRGAPLDQSGHFMAPWFTHFNARGATGVLDWYTLMVGVFSLCALSAHGALFIAWRNDGPVRERALRMARLLWPVVAAVGLLVVVATAVVRPEIYRGLLSRPWAWPLALVALLGLVGALVLRGRDLLAFLASSAFLAGTLMATAAGLFPLLLPSTVDPAFHVTAQNAAAGEHGLRIGLVWWSLGMALAVSYTAYVFRTLRGKAQAEDH
jgi:cytochrome d ubiquinol oxidase subunit II